MHTNEATDAAFSASTGENTKNVVTLIVQITGIYNRIVFFLYY